jgi:hypothetical protein
LGALGEEVLPGKPLLRRYLQGALTTCARKPTSEAAFLCYREGVREAARAKEPMKEAR